MTRSDLCVPVGKLCHTFGIGKAKAVVKGGTTRAGIGAAGPEGDLGSGGAGGHSRRRRPFVSPELLDRVLCAAAETGAAAPAVPVKDTVKRAEQGIVLETVDRSTLYAVQTPQVFQADFISAALYTCIQEGVELTDDCSAADTWENR